MTLDFETAIQIAKRRVAKLKSSNEEGNEEKIREIETRIKALGRHPGYLSFLRLIDLLGDYPVHKIDFDEEDERKTSAAELLEILQLLSRQTEVLDEFNPPMRISQYDLTTLLSGLTCFKLIRKMKLDRLSSRHFQLVRALLDGLSNVQSVLLSIHQTYAVDVSFIRPDDVIEELEISCYDGAVLPDQCIDCLASLKALKVMNNFLVVLSNFF